MLTFQDDIITVFKSVEFAPLYTASYSFIDINALKEFLFIGSQLTSTLGVCPMCGGILNIYRTSNKKKEFVRRCHNCITIDKI